MLIRSFVSLIVLGTVWICNSPVAEAQFGGLFGGSKVQTISTKDVVRMIAEQQKAQQESEQQGQPANPADFILVDVRSDKEIAVSIIPGAITKADFEKNQANYRDKLVIPYCTVGGRSEKYAKKLLQDGWKVKNYKGSILEWVQAEQPLVTLKGQPTMRVHTYSSSYRIPDKYQQVSQ